MKRVLQIFGKLGRGGLESFVMNLYRAIDKDCLQFDFLLTSPDGEFEQEALSMGARLFYVPSRSSGLRKYREALDRFFAEHSAEFSAVHLHVSSLSSIEPLIYARKHGVAVRIIHSHSSSVKHNLKSRAVHQILHTVNKLRIRGLATHYLGCSDKALDWLFKGSGVRSKAVMINNGIDTSLYKYDLNVRDEVRDEFNIGKEYVMGHVGSFIHVKNHEFLICLFDRIHKQNPNTKLMLVGNGPMKERIEHQIKELGLESSVILTGSRPDVNRLLQAMDLVVMPSFFEGLPVSLVEAQAAGLPVIASDTITRDVALTSNIQFISLKSEMSAWENTAMRALTQHRRADTSDMVRARGFDITEISIRLSSIYFQS